LKSRKEGDQGRKEENEGGWTNLRYNTYIRGNVNKTPWIVNLRQKCLFSPKNEGQEGKTGPVWGVGTNGRGENERKG
jgi:hypothetical protein